MAGKTRLSRSGLDLRAESFCNFFAAIGTETFSRGERSAIAAKYSEKSARNVATALLKRPAVQARIAELHQANMVRNGITVDKVLADLENLRILSEDKGDYSTSFRCSEAQGKFLAMFTDRTEIMTPEHRAELDESERRVNQRIAAVVLGMLPGPGGDGDEAAVRMLGEGVERPDGEGLHPQAAGTSDSNRLPSDA